MNVSTGDEHVVCNLCGADDTRSIYPDTRNKSVPSEAWEPFRCTHSAYGVHARIVECNQCRLRYADPRPAPDDILQNYEDVEDPLYEQERYGRERTFRRHLRSLQKYAGNGNKRRLLDIGAYLGIFVEIAEEAGWDSLGLEPSQWAVSYARGRGVPVVQGTLDSANLPDNHFAAVTMWDVIEHVHDPMRNLQEMYRVVEPGGWVAVHTMDANSLMARLLRQRWPWLMEMHIYYFTKETLRKMLEEAGFEVASIRPEGRYLSVGYLATRLVSYSPPLSKLIERFADTLHLDRWLIPINMGDLITAYAQKPQE